MNEELDRNKSALTHTATAVAASWLDTIGCKPVETEVTVGDGWIADVASFWSPTLTEARKSRLLRPPIIPHEVENDSYAAMNRLFRSYGGRLTIIVEVKTSRSDFLADVGRKYGTLGGGRHRRASLMPPAHLCVLATPPGIVGEEEHLIDWGHLLLSADCSRVRKWNGDWNANPQHPRQIEDLIAAVAIRRDNVTRYASLRRWQKAWRAQMSGVKA